MDEVEETSVEPLLEAGTTEEPSIGGEVSMEEEPDLTEQEYQLLSDYFKSAFSQR